MAGAAKLAGIGTDGFSAQPATQRRQSLNLVSALASSSSARSAV
jgi:hypothetical protein